MRDVFRQFWQMIEKHRKLMQIAKIKEQFYRTGLTNQISFYGIQAIPNQNGDKYRRIEVFSDKPFLQQDIRTIHSLFLHMLIDKTDSIYVYHNKQIKELKIID